MHGGADWTRARHARGGVHPRRGLYVRADAGRVEAQRLVKRRRLLPRHTEAHEQCDTGDGRREGEGLWGWWRCTQRVHGGTDWALGTATREGGAHVKHLAHVRDAGRFEGQRLVERRRALPSHTKAHGGRHGGIEAGRRGGRWRRCTEGLWPDTGGHGTLGGTADARGRTRNMPLIFVTPVVSRCSGWLKADAPCRVTTGLSGQGIPGDRGYQDSGGRAWGWCRCTQRVHGRPRLDTGGHGTRGSAP